MPSPEKPPRGLSFVGYALTGISGGGGYSQTDDPPQLKLEADKDVYRPGDPVTITVEIKNPTALLSLLIGKLSFEIKGIEMLDTNWFNIPKPSPDSKQRRGEYVFMDWSSPVMVSNQILSSEATKRYVVRTILPNIIPPSYRGATIRYFYYVRSTLSAQYLILENGHSPRDPIQDLPELALGCVQEAKIPLQIWVTEEANGLLSEEGQSDGIVPIATVLLEVYWKEMDTDSEWIKANGSFADVEEAYESSRDEATSVSSYNPMKEGIDKTFGSSLSMQSSIARTIGAQQASSHCHFTSAASRHKIPFCR